MSDHNEHPTPAEEPEAAPADAEQEIGDGDLEDVSGGIIEGGCIPLPWEKPIILL